MKHDARKHGTRTLIARGGVALLVLLSIAAPLGAANDRELTEIAQRLNAGDRTAIEDLLARTRPAQIDLDAAQARLGRLRAEIDVLRSRRAARPAFPLSSGFSTAPFGTDEPSDEGVSTRVDGLREALAWLRAGEPDRALRAVPTDGDEAHYVEARALEALGRRTEALQTYRRVAAEASSPVLRARAAGDVAHLEWRERLARTPEGRP